MKEAIDEGSAAGLEDAELSEGRSARFTGRLYCAPLHHSAVLEVDPVERAVHLSETAASGDLKWGGVVAAANGRLYCAPRLRSSARSQREIHWQQLLRAARSIR